MDMEGGEGWRYRDSRVARAILGAAGRSQEKRNGVEDKEVKRELRRIEVGISGQAETGRLIERRDEPSPP